MRHSPAMIPVLLIAALSFLLLYAVLCVSLYVRQDNYVYYPTSKVNLTPAMLGVPCEEVRFTTADNETIAAWYTPGKEATPDTPTVLFCHGNAGNIGDRATCIQTIHEMGLNVFIFDYRGYGESTGNPSEAGTYEDARAAWQYLTTTRSVPPDNMIFYGRSLGGAVASWLATQHRPRLLLIEASFTNVNDMGKRMFPFLPVSWLVRYRYDTLANIQLIDCPVYISHSPDDRTVPYYMGERLFEAASSPKGFYTLSGGHNLGGLDADSGYRDAMLEFLAGTSRR